MSHPEGSYAVPTVAPSDSTTAAARWVRTTARLRSVMSSTSPATMPSSRRGTKIATVVAPVASEECVRWKTKSGTEHSGLVSFHEIGPNLTRVMVTVDFHPTGMMEKMASGMRFVKRAVQSDLARFKSYVELQDVKGLEYGHPGEDEDASRGSSNGNGNAAKSSKEIDESRQQRAERREQRRH